MVIDMPSPVAENTVSMGNLKMEPEVSEPDTAPASQASSVCIKVEQLSVNDNKHKRRRVYSNWITF